MDAKLAARRNNESDNKRLKYEYQCSICKEWHPDKNIEVDHLIPAGSLRSGDDLKGFVERLFCEKEGLRVLCKPCHRIVTNENADAKT
jgi:5-methylcytosine-specific restriction endonuclease McrA